MISVKKYDSQGREAGTVELPEQLFGDVVNEHVLWLSVRAYLAHQRQGTSSVKNRARIRGGGRKPFKQKGTGQARQGTRRSPLMVGGARAFGPRPRTYTVRLPRRVKALGIRSALSLAAKQERVAVWDDPRFETPKTKDMAGILANMGAGDTKCLVITDVEDKNTFLSGRNLPKITVSNVLQMNAYQLLNCERLILTQSALSKLSEGGA